MERMAVDKGVRTLLALSWTTGVFAVAVALISIEVGWRPPIPLWDERARLATKLVLWAEMLAMCVGLASSLPQVRWPERLRGLSATGATIVPGFFILQSLELSAGMSALDVARTLVPGLAYGLACSVFVAFVSSFSPEEDGDGFRAVRNPWAPLWPVGICLIVWAAVALSPRAPDNGHLQVLLRLKNRETTLTISVKEIALVGEKVGILTIVDRSKSNALVLDEDEWRSLLRVWNDAHRAQGAGRGVATIKDTAPPDRTLLELEGSAAGAHLRMSSSRGSTVDFQVDPANLGPVSAALTQADELLRR